MQINRQFPPAFSLYRESGFGRSYMIGVHQNQPLYAVSIHSGWSGQPDVVLHSGASDRLPPLAGVDANAFGRSATVDLPPLPGSGLAGSQERLEMSGAGFGHASQLFSIEVGTAGGGGGGGPRERFEWRHSHGAEVDRLGGRGQGWKLVRLDSDAAAGGLRGGAQFARGAARTSDGLEVVAVWANASMSMSKELNFQFLGSGESGVLGERWAVMAVITALRIFDKEKKSSAA